MKRRKSITAGLALLLTAGTALSATSAPAAAKPSRTAAKPAASKSRGKKSSKHSKRERGQKAPAPERISEIQTALAKDGSFNGTANGKWDDATVAAMKKFQTAHGLNPSGKLDAHTLQKLGLGSQTAGVAAPMPPVTTSSVATAPAQTAQRQ
jgi:peptidoglycan hydrolase-like protein with peptidoglycan-binding domain